MKKLARAVVPAGEPRGHAGQVAVSISNTARETIAAIIAWHWALSVLRNITGKDGNGFKP